MKSLSKSLFVAAGFLAATGSAIAATQPFPLPEPGSLALVGVAIAGLVYVVRRKK